ncbi:MAG: hypothetical protein HUJ56_13745, partial [Erysipelotrichaceae bacterium]|nr:hypothetical protein [Erysipelotrichaceae bacterium]
MIDTMFRSIRKDFDRALYYWVVLALSSMIIYMFFHLACSEEIGVTFINADNGLPIYLMMFSVAMCMIVILLANDFYMKKKAKDLAILLICGCTYIELVEFLVLQTITLLAVAIPAGMLAGKLCMPLLASVLSMIEGAAVTIHPTGEAVIGTTGAMIFLIIWIILFNLSYCYQSTINSLLHAESSPSQKMKVGGKKNVLSGLVNVIFPILYVGCAILIYFNSQDLVPTVLLTIVGMLAMMMTLGSVVYPMMKYMISSIFLSDAVKMAYWGLFREDIKLITNYLALFTGTCICLTAAMVSVSNDIHYVALLTISYVMLMPLLALALMFKFSTEIIYRIKSFYTMHRWGMLKEQLRGIVRKEVFMLYAFSIITVL